MIFRGVCQAGISVDYAMIAVVEPVTMKEALSGPDKEE